MREVSAVIAGAAVRYWVMERDEPGIVVLLHGLGSDHSGLAELAERVTCRTVVVPDLPGFGASAPLPGLNSLVGYAGVVDGLRRQLGADRIAVSGHSLGASIALVHAGRYPETVDALALFNPVTGVSGFAGQLSRAYYDIGASLPAPLARAWLTSRAAVWVADQFVMRTGDPARRRAILAQDYVAYRRADLRAVQESFRSYYDTDFAGYAARVTAPTLLVTGKRDGLAPPASVRRLAETMRHAGDAGDGGDAADRGDAGDAADGGDPADVGDPVPGATGGARLVVVDRAGHLFPAEEPDAAGALLDGFLTHRRSPVDNIERAL